MKEGGTLLKWRKPPPPFPPEAEFFSNRKSGCFFFLKLCITAYLLINTKLITHGIAYTKAYIVLWNAWQRHLYILLCRHYINAQKASVSFSLLCGFSIILNIKLEYFSLACGGSTSTWLALWPPHKWYPVSWHPSPCSLCPATPAPRPQNKLVPVSTP